MIDDTNITKTSLGDWRFRVHLQSAYGLIRP